MGEDVFLHQQVHQIPSREVLHHQVEVIGILKRTFQANNPRIFFRVSEHVPLFTRLHDFVLENHFRLFELLDSYRLSRLIPLA